MSNDNPAAVVVSAEDRASAVFKQVQDSFAGMAGGMEATSSKVNSVVGMFTKVQAAALTLAGAGGFGALIMSIAHQNAALDDMAERTGSSVENLSAVTKIARTGGHDMEAFEKVMIKFNVALSGADENSGKTARALKAIGLSVDELRGKDPAENMMAIAKALDQFKEGGTKSALAVDLLGKSGAAALPMFKDMAETGELNGRVTAEQAAQAELFEKSVKRLSGQFGGLGRTVANEVIPVLQSALDIIDDIAKGKGATQEVHIGWLDQMMASVATGFSKTIHAAEQWKADMARAVGLDRLADLYQQDADKARAGMENVASKLLNDARRLAAQADRAWEKEQAGPGPGKPKLDYQGTDEAKIKAHEDALKRVNDLLAKDALQYKELIDAFAQQGELVGKSAEQQAVLNSERKIEVDLARTLLEINRQDKLTTEEKAAAEAKARAAAAIAKAQVPGAARGLFGAKEADQEERDRIARMASLQGKVFAIEQGQRSPAEVEQDQFDERMRVLEAGRDQALAAFAENADMRMQLEQQYNAAAEQELLRHEAARGSIEAQAALERQAFAQMTHAQQLQVQQMRNAQSAGLMAAGFQDAYTVMQVMGLKHTALAKALFIASKAAAISEIFIQTQLGAAKAVGQTGIFGLSMAAIIEATGYARMAAVAATGWQEMRGGGGGGSIGGSLGGGLSTGAAAVVDTTPAAPATRAQAAESERVIRFDFVNVPDVLSKRFLADELIPKLGEVLGDGWGGNTRFEVMN